MAAPDASREDLAASVAARRELGPDYEDAVLESFLSRMESTIAARVDARVEERTGGKGRARNAPAGKDNSDKVFILSIISLGTGIPISAIAVTQADLPGLVVAWLGIVGVNVAHALSGRR